MKEKKNTTETLDIFIFLGFLLLQENQTYFPQNQKQLTQAANPNPFLTLFTQCQTCGKKDIHEILKILFY